jgi:hypothetical protein
MQGEALRKTSSLIRTKIPNESTTWISEIPCRVSNIAQGSGDTIPMTGSNRWNPNDVCASASRAIPRVRLQVNAISVAWFPRNDLRSEILRWSRYLVHNTPALTAKNDEISSNLRRSDERIVYAASNRGNHEVPTCTNGVTLAPLSRPETQ